MKDQNVKPMYVGVNEVCADWGCSRSKAACFGGPDASALGDQHSIL